MGLGSRINAAGLASLALMAGAASVWAAPALPVFPRSTGLSETGRWLASQTDLPLSAVVLVGPGYVFAFETPDPAVQAGGLVWKDVREEVTSQAMANRLNGRSATASLAFDCGRNQATASNVLVYAGNSRKGEPARSMPAAEWLTANPGLYLMDLAQAACSDAFTRPFAALGGSVRVSETAAAPPANAPAPRQVARGEIGPDHWVQVGAFANVGVADARWRAIQKLIPAQSAGRSVRTEPVGRGGKTLVRALVGPFHGPAAARDFCAALKARGGDCMVR